MITTSQHRRLWFLAPASLLAAFVAGCGGDGGGGAPPAGTETAPAVIGGPSAPSGPIKLMFITNSNADWWNAVEKGMQDGAQAFQVQAEMRRNEGSTQGQINLLQTALSLPDIQGVAVSVIEAEAPGVIDAMKELRKAGKVVIAIDSDVAPSAADARLAYIGTDNVKAGEAAGRAAAAVRPAGGKTVVFVGTSSAANARERSEGFFKGAGAPFGGKSLETFDDGGDHGKAATNVQNAVTKYPDLGVLLGLWSYNAPAIAEEVGKSPELRKKASVVTFDLDEAAVGHLEKGNIDVTVCQNPYEMGFQGVKALKAFILNDKAMVESVLPDGKTRETGVRVIVPKADSPVFKNKEKGDDVITIEEMKAWLASKGLKSS
ncbi:MAG: substrate-binding domain-containing protein [Isosphaeraceae bacterium]|nr:substrate-binding domain-containing protein [Isosphaeraceae bacterium]